MAPSSTHALKAAVLTLIISTFSISLLLSINSVDAMKSSEMGLEQHKLVGSRPPRCVNKCLACKPCKATLVIPSHHQHSYKTFVRASISKEEDENYYLLSWKCRCGDKIFEP